MSKQLGKSFTLEEKLALAAYWLCQKKSDGEFYRQSDLPDLLGVPLKSWERSRLASEAMARGFFSVTPRLSLPLELLKVVESETANFSDLESRLKKHFPSLNRLVVAHGAYEDPGTDDEAWDASVRMFSDNLASVVLNLIELQPKPMTIGLGWGRTLASLVEAIDARQPWSLWQDQGEKNIFHCFPMWGSLHKNTVSSQVLDKLAVNRFGTSSTGLTQILQRTLKGSEDSTPSLLGLPAILPMKWQGDAFASRKRQFLEFISDFTAYDEIFGLPERRDTDRPLIDRMDCCIVTIGSASHPTRFLSGNSFGHFFGADWENQFDAHCAGYIGGVLLPKESEIFDESEAFISRVSDFLTCTQRHHLHRLSSRCKYDESKIGVCAVVHGSARVGAVISALNYGLINTLCICQHLTKSIVSWLDKKEQIEKSRQQT